MAALNLITSVPEILSYSVLSDWLPAHQLARLDSAFCSRACRQPLLNLFKSKDLIYQQTWPVSGVEVFEWLLLRGMKVSKFAFVVDIEKIKVVQNYFKSQEQHVREISCQTEAKRVKDVMATHCRHLTHVSFKTPARGELLVFRNNPHLQELGFSMSLRHTLELLKTIKLPALAALAFDATYTCPDLIVGYIDMASSLLRLSITFAEPTGKYFYMPHFAPLCPHLRSLELNSPILRYSELVAFATLCPHIVNLSVCLSRALTDAGILSVMRNLPQLRTLNLQSCTLLTDLSIQYNAEHCSDALVLLHIESKLITLAALDALRAQCGAKLTVNSRRVIHKGLYYGDCGNATVLDVSFNFSRTFICNVAKCCPRLEVLDLSGCEALELDIGRVRLLRKCFANLHTVVLRPCDKATYMGIFMDSGLNVDSECPAVHYKLGNMPV